VGLGDVLGQDFAISSLRSALRSGKVATAYLLHGPAGVGKRKAALAFAKALNCSQASGEACDVCLNCRRVDRGTHPDVVTVGVLPGKTRLLIEQVKEIEHELSLAPFEARKRVYIIDQVELMSPEATGAVLKTLEEPPANTVFLLLTEQPATLAPTIVSRCQSLRFTPLSKERVQTILEKNGISREVAAIASRFAQGSVERALSFEHNAFLERRRQLVDLYYSASVDDITSLSEAVSEVVGNKGRDVPSKESRKRRVSQTLEIMLSWCRDVLMARCGSPQTLFANEDMADEIKEEASRVSRHQAQELLQAALAAVRRVERNVAPEAALQAMFLHLARVRAGRALQV